jgi:hypothetical protein
LKYIRAFHGKPSPYFLLLNVFGFTLSQRSAEGGYSPQGAAANFSGDPATPPNRIEELQTGREGLWLRERRTSVLSGHVLSGLAAVRWVVESMAAAPCGE